MQSASLFLSVAVALLLALNVYSTASDSPSPAEERQTGGSNQAQCLQEGGICVSQESCSSDKRVNKTGLCPEAEVCCNGLPGDSSCSQRGGRCGSVEECENTQRFGQLDCEEGYQCCLIIF